MNETTTKNPNKELIYQAFGVDITKKAERIFLANQSFIAFNLIYLPHHFQLPPAEFHPTLALVLQDQNITDVLIEGFRGSAKSTYGSLAFPLWAALCRKYNFFILINETRTQMQLNITNIRKEIEENELIMEDFPMSLNKARWTDEALELPNDVYILGRSRGQKIRGLRYRQYRPQVIIGDDVEDLEWVRKKENRDKTDRWWHSEVIPAQQESGAKLVNIGNLLHQDALMRRLERTGLYKVLKFPLFDDDGKITWLGKYPTDEAVEHQRKRVSSQTAWSREYLLKVISEDEQVIKEEDIVRYPNKILDERFDNGKPIYPVKDAAIASDLAISEKQTADFTAIVGGVRVEYNSKDRILIKPNIINKRMDFDSSQSAIRNFYDSMPLGCRVGIEDVAYQKAAIQELKRKGVPARGIRPISDKRARLETIAPYIKDGTVMFPEHGADELLEQLLGFGVEQHDDLVDALVYLVLLMIDKKKNRVGVGRIDAL